MAASNPACPWAAATAAAAAAAMNPAWINIPTSYAPVFATNAPVHAASAAESDSSARVCPRTGQTAPSTSAPAATVAAKPATTSAPAPAPTNGKRARHPWSDEEVAALMLGVQRHGVGGWSAMVADPGLPFDPRRRPADLKDKWRCMTTRRPAHVPPVPLDVNHLPRAYNPRAPKHMRGVPIPGTHFAALVPVSGTAQKRAREDDDDDHAIPAHRKETNIGRDSPSLPTPSTSSLASSSMSPSPVPPTMCPFSGLWRSPDAVAAAGLCPRPTDEPSDWLSASDLFQDVPDSWLATSGPPALVDADPLAELLQFSDDEGDEGENRQWMESLTVALTASQSLPHDTETAMQVRQRLDVAARALGGTNDYIVRTESTTSVGAMWTGLISQCPVASTAMRKCHAQAVARPASAPGTSRCPFKNALTTAGVDTSDSSPATAVMATRGPAVADLVTAIRHLDPETRARTLAILHGRTFAAGQVQCVYREYLVTLMGRYPVDALAARPAVTAAPAVNEIVDDSPWASLRRNRAAVANRLAALDGGSAAGSGLWRRMEEQRRGSSMSISSSNSPVGAMMVGTDGDEPAMLAWPHGGRPTMGPMMPALL
ncbi:hypothetical protein AMAG_02772 [Allomyces macrogynus ATCC 38327]|uniref:Myb-like domain-containing protein n=1 Tax=Allomyces macrogynus (strain ATCC 38327) TaxID=578462 RepID=A0A0L0S3A1_ALLM3|nr:hypothetical protein AMAG_02772 [Allomyces macrogynus ATCC 38327]|eukprot:KNE57012.1 hypothetical protein AMAG_02772 [Allomyces macrogynus ATCC 38327]